MSGLEPFSLSVWTRNTSRTSQFKNRRRAFTVCAIWFETLLPHLPIDVDRPERIGVESSSPEHENDRDLFPNGFLLRGLPLSGVPRPSVDSRNQISKQNQENLACLEKGSRNGFPLLLAFSCVLVFGLGSLCR